jgi:release factor glutamine methyltransferase
MEQENLTAGDCPPTLSGLLRQAASALPGEDARADAELLLAAAMHRPRSWLYAHADEAPAPEALRRFQDLLDRRQRGEPVAYILGRREFWSLDLEVGSDTLVPRPETELLVELALERLPIAAPARVIDLGTGSGAIALAVASERPQARVTAVDASAPALAFAQRNGARLGLERVRFLRSDWFSAVRDESFELVLSNPPYLADDDPHLREGDLRFEPAMALSCGRDGLEALRRICADAPARLAAGGWLLFEHGLSQGEAARTLLAEAGLESVQTWRDLEGRERVSGARKPVAHG